jgi:pimeloyl-ACP methyl ester carboxylesterase
MNILIHGFNVKNPENSTGKLREHLENCNMFNYGWRLFSVLWHNRKDAKRLKKLLGTNLSPNVFAHSNGCAIAVEAAKRGANIKNLVCINPALKRDAIFPAAIERIIVIHTNHDIPTRAAAFFDKVPLLQLFVPNAWGKMGAKGSSASDGRVVNLDFTVHLDGHSDFFDNHNLKNLMPIIKSEMVI